MFKTRFNIQGTVTCSAPGCRTESECVLTVTGDGYKTYVSIAALPEGWRSGYNGKGFAYCDQCCMKDIAFYEKCIKHLEINE